MKRPASDELTDAELEELDGLLARVEGGKIPSTEALDGFFAALACCPEMIMPSEYLPVIQSGETGDGDLIFENTEEANRFCGRRHADVRFFSRTARCISARGETIHSHQAKDRTERAVSLWLQAEIQEVLRIESHPALNCGRDGRRKLFSAIARPYVR